MDFDTAVKLNIYETIARTTQAPTSADVAEALSTSPEEVAAALERLHKQRLLVPEPGNPSRIRMAPPFSGVETSFRVQMPYSRIIAKLPDDVSLQQLAVVG